MKLGQTSFFSHLKFLKENHLKGSGLFGANTRPLSTLEISTLKTQGVLCDDWTLITVIPSFSPSKIFSTRLVGKVVLGSAELYFSTIENSEIASDVKISHCSLIRRCIIETGSNISSSILDCSRCTSYGNGQLLSLGLETGGRKGMIWAGATFDEVIQSVKDGALRQEINSSVHLISWDFSVVSTGVCIDSCGKIDQFYLSSNTSIKNAGEFTNSTALGAAEELTSVASGSIVRNSILMEGVSVDSGALVSESALMEHSAAQRHVLITQSVIGPDSHCGEGEITSSLVGPFVGFHHQSLLIAAWWPEGRGNIGYGAMVGSNHTSRVPDQEILPGEGTFFGLGCAIKFPCNFSRAPYSLISTGVIVPSQSLGLPFSLILSEPLPLLPGFNRIIPGWVLSDNIYSLLRQEGKFKKRQTARRHNWDFRVFRPSIAENILAALSELEQFKDKDHYIDIDSPLIGKNYLTEADRLEAIQTYKRFLTYALMRLKLEPRFGGPGAQDDWIQMTADKANISLPSGKDLEQVFLQFEEAMWESALKSREKDMFRGKRIIPDYEQTHGPTSEDPFLVEKKSEISAYKVLFKG